LTIPGERDILVNAVKMYRKEARDMLNTLFVGKKNTGSMGLLGYLRALGME